MKKLASSLVRSYKVILVFWIIAILSLGYFALQLPSLLEGDGFRTDGEYEKVQDILEEDFGFPDSTLLLLFEKDQQTQAEFEETIESTLQEVEVLDLNATIQHPLEDNSFINETYAYASLHFEEPFDTSKVTRSIESVIEGNNIILTGEPVISDDINKASQNDLKRAELIGVPVALVILILAFGTVIASLLPLVIGGITIIIGFGILAIIGQQMDLSIFILNIAPMIGLALSIDFALLFINRYREEMDKSSKSEALITTITTAGRSILFSAICVFIGLGAMSVIRVDIFTNIAVGGTVVIVIAVLSSLTLLPALLYVAGDSLNRWRIVPNPKDVRGRWRAFAKSVMKRPILIALTALVLLSIGILPISNMNLTIPTISSLPESYESRAAYETIDEEFMGDSESTLYAVAERENGWEDEEGLEELKTLENELSQPDIVSSVDTIYTTTDVDNSSDFSAALDNDQMSEQLQPALEQFIKDEQLLIPIQLSVAANSSEAQELLSNWAERNWEQHLQFGGQPKFNEEIYTEIYEKIGLTLLIILLSTFIILTIAFRSIIIPLKAIIMNVLGLASTFGVIVWLFQGGHFGLEAADVALILPVIVFSLVFGLSMDYEVFLISRIHEFYLQTGDNTKATIEGLASTSKIITSAALIMIVITGAFAFTGVVPVKQIGIGIAIAILIDATIIRLLLVPSLMKLLGDWNWWLPFSKRRS
ncbi:transporter [Halobacillus andaensis]|uniref:Transporter n=1 Tax=Halobacillus andaensis TaxID=1176239 RepID=A0A917BBC3_HALAA|nr:MMPL family transporter [Halobacillus andaensis]MBP2006271.1 RND superfamily putative drug exporter [Halobacillus andaensis]GGF33890.1 transporter [Halobacillus andaensis]